MAGTFTKTVLFPTGYFKKKYIYICLIPLKKNFGPTDFFFIRDNVSIKNWLAMSASFDANVSFDTVYKARTLSKQLTGVCSYIQSLVTLDKG